ncbi:hypothetical protein JYQ62_11265 [Nostoc sp. UHCC 0702]|nr:hypothetical protein JYQ62_11265 [Nostoc sp. UHCC 0702]
MRKIIYEKPTLNKYGTMKEFTHNTLGSGSDNFGRSGSTNANVSAQNGDPGISIQNDTLLD